MTENDNLLYCLLKLTWEGCGDGIRTVIDRWLGMMAFIIAAITFAFLNWMVNIYPYLTTMAVTSPPIPSDVRGLMMAAYIGSWNAFCLLTFIAIASGLFTFAVEFTYICYYYDDCSWAIPNQFISFGKWVVAGYKKFRMAKAVYVKERHDELVNKIKEIKKSDWL
jgi:hypothetical protein